MVTLNLYLISGDPGSDFTIGTSSGALTTKSTANLDYESSQSHTLTVEASDGIASATTVVQVRIDIWSVLLPFNAKTSSWI